MLSLKSGLLSNHDTLFRPPKCLHYGGSTVVYTPGGSGIAHITCNRNKQGDSPPLRFFLICPYSLSFTSLFSSGVTNHSKEDTECLTKSLTDALSRLIPATNTSRTVTYHNAALMHVDKNSIDHIW